MLFYNFSKYLLACFPISPSFAFSVFILLASIFFSLPIFLVTVFTKKYYIFSNTQVIDITCYKCQLFFFFPAKKYISGVLTVVQQIQPLAWHGGLRTWPCRASASFSQNLVRNKQAPPETASSNRQYAKTKASNRHRPEGSQIMRGAFTDMRV